MDLSKHRLLAGTLGVALVALAASFLSPAAVAEPPDHASSASPAEEAASVAWTDLDWHDAARERAVPARLYLPTGDGPHALVVFSHGIGGSRAGYSYLGRHFAGQGIASLHVQHVGSDRSLWAGNPLTLVARLHGAAQESEAMHRARDVSFALDRLLAGPHGAAVDVQRIAVAGHSYGANTAMLATGARVVRDGRAVELRDARFKAALLLSSPPFYGERDLSAVLRDVSVPSLHVTTTEDVIRIPGYESPASDRISVFDAFGGERKALAVFAGGSHSVFTDRLGTGGGVSLNQRIKAATRELAVAFVKSAFDGGEAPLRDWGERHRELVARYAIASP
jgi:dienelactone hydrolase